MVVRTEVVLFEVVCEVQCNVGRRGGYEKESRVEYSLPNVYVDTMGLVGTFFFFQAEDGIRDIGVTGVQTCALPIFRPQLAERFGAVTARVVVDEDGVLRDIAAVRDLRQDGGGRQLVEACGGPHGREIGRASCRERV